MATAQEKVSFELSFKEPQAHYVEVKMELKGLKKGYVDLKMPVWSPGSYLIREYPKNVEDFGATSGNKTLVSEKVSKNTWRVHTGGASDVVVNYRVYGFEISVRTSMIDENHAFLSPTGTFMYVDGMLDLPAEVSVIPHARWSKISTGLEPVAGKKNTFYAEDFDILFDAPIEVGNQEVFEFTAAGVKHEVAMVGYADYDPELLKRDMARIVEEQTRMFGVNPNKRYVFIIHHYAAGGGGLEHLNSTVLGVSRNAYKSYSGYLGFLGLVAHEYFHVWNVKRLRPEALGPFNYDEENYTTNLWVSEGFTAYYDNLTLQRTGFTDETSYLKLIANDIETVENRPGNLVQPLSLSSFDAWIKQYRPDENSANTTISYYNKGALIGMLVDLKTLHATKGEKRLDDILKAMYERFYVKEDRGFKDAEFKAMAEKVAGVSMDDIYVYVNQARPIDYNAYLNSVGYELVDQLEGASIPDFGVRLSDGKVMSVGRGSGAWDGGINVNDELIAVNGFRIDPTGRELDRVLAQSKVGEELKVLLSRDGMMREVKISLPRSTRGDYVIQPLTNATAEQLALRKIWLSLN